MLFRTNVFALVGGGATPAAPPHRVVVWDAAAAAPAGELTFRSAVAAVALRRDGVAVALKHRTLFYSLADLRLVAAADTGPNDAGLLALASGPRRVFAVPAPARGGLRVEHVDAGRTVFIAAHSNRLAAVALSADGGVVATASARGTVVRVFAAADGARLRELRRGAEPAAVLGLAFGPGPAPRWLAGASDRGSAHLWWLGPPSDAADADAASPPPPRARFAAAARSLAARLAPSLAAVRSRATLRLPPCAASEGCALAFSPDGRELRLATRGGAYAAHAVPEEGRGGGEGGGEAAEVGTADLASL